MKHLLILAVSLVLAGCASLGKGVAEAVLERKDSKDTRACVITGKSFGGIAPSLENNKGRTKVLMVHGVGTHVPGYSKQFLEKLGRELGLTVRNSQHIDLDLTDSDDPDRELGTLRVNRLLNQDETKELP